MARAPAPFLQAVTDLIPSTMNPAPRVALAGDAAFVARPHVGMGATKAMEDAAALADALAASGGDVPSGLRAYDARRWGYGAALVMRGRDLGTPLCGNDDADRRLAERYRDPGVVMAQTAVPPEPPST